MIFDIEDGILKGYENPDKETEVIIPDGVTEIGFKAFFSNNIIRRVVIPDSVKSIRNCAFMCCSNLYEVVFGKGIRSICAGAFEKCSSLREIVLHDGIESLGGCAFKESGIEQITIPDGIVKIDWDVFSGTPWIEAQCDKEFVMLNPSTLLMIHSEKETIRVPDGVRCIARNVLAGRTAETVREIILPDSTEVICISAFGESAIRKIQLGNNVRYIDDIAFYNCKHLEDINFPESLVHVGGCILEETLWAKQHKQGMIMLNSHLLLCADHEAENIVLPEGIVEIAPLAFSNSKLQHIIIPSTLRSIGFGAFGGCVGLRNVVFNEGLEHIGGILFFSCNNLERVTIPSTLKSVDAMLFGRKTPYSVVELGFRVKESILEVFGHIENCIVNESYIAPHIPITAMDKLSKAAARGFMKCTVEGSKYDDEVIDGYRKYIEENSAEFYSQVCKYPFVLHYLCSEKLIPAEDIEMLLDIVKDDIQLTALLLEYSADQKRKDYDI